MIFYLVLLFILFRSCKRKCARSLLMYYNPISVICMYFSIIIINCTYKQIQYRLVYYYYYFFPRWINALLDFPQCKLIFEWRTKMCARLDVHERQANKQYYLFSFLLLLLLLLLLVVVIFIQSVSRYKLYTYYVYERISYTVYYVVGYNVDI